MTLTTEHPGAAATGTDLLLSIRGLHTNFTTAEGVVRAVDGVDLDVRHGTTLCVVGESGCGKSVTARSILQLVDRPGNIESGEVNWRSSVDGSWVDLAALDRWGDRLRAVRGGEIGMVFQEPMASLSPMYTVGEQLTEAIQLHQEITEAEAKEEAVSLLRRVGIPQPEKRFSTYPFQMSGGMCQRTMIAVALACEPALLIADEPTTALDVTTQARILDLLKELQCENGMAMMFITHDLGVVAEIADEVAVMYLGSVVERGSVEQIFDEPKHPYTRALLRSIPRMRSGGQREKLSAIAGMVPHPLARPNGCGFHTRCVYAMAGTCDTITPPLNRFGSAHEARCHLYDENGVGEVPDESTGSENASGSPVEVAEPAPAPDDSGVSAQTATVVDISGLSVEFPVRSGVFGRTTGAVHAVNNVDLSIRQGETLGLVGESGCGKTTLGRCLTRILRPSGGSIRYTTADGERIDLATISNREMAPYRREIRMIFQDPFSSLNPRMTLLDLVGEPLRTNRIAGGKKLEDMVAEMLERVGLRPEYMRRYPHAFSGGERQRINIARALITRPRLVVADEAVSALDVSVRAQILNLLADLQRDFDLTYLFVSHDLSVIEHLCDRVAVMYLGSLVETADTATLYREPHHPYTETLLAAVPKPDPHLRHTERTQVSDVLPDPINPPPGCLFHTRCPYTAAGTCDTRVPALDETGPGHRTACHRVGELELGGITRNPEAER